MLEAVKALHFYGVLLCSELLSDWHHFATGVKCSEINLFQVGRWNELDFFKFLGQHYTQLII